MVIKINNIEVSVKFKQVENIRLTIKSNPDLSKSVVLSVPAIFKNLDYIYKFLNSKINWINKHYFQTAKFAKVRRKKQIVFDQEEKFYILGKEYLFNFITLEKTPKKEDLIYIDNHHINFINFLDLNNKKQNQIFDEFIKKILEKHCFEYCNYYQQLIGVSYSKLKIRRMLSKWGSCNVTKKIITLNLELVKKPPEIIKYVVVHELLHLVEPSHNARFKNLMSFYVPEWKELSKQIYKYQ